MSNPVKRPCKPQYTTKPARDPETWLYSTPLGSPSPWSKRSYVHAPGVPHHAVEGGLYTGMGPGGYAGWVYRVGSREGNTGTQQCCSRRGPDPAKRARSPCKGRSGGVWGSDVPAAGAGSWYHPPGPVGASGPPCTRTP